jgi:hypothetical protein
MRFALSLGCYRSPLQGFGFAASQAVFGLEASYGQHNFPRKRACLFYGAFFLESVRFLEVFSHRWARSANPIQNTNKIAETFVKRMPTRHYSALFFITR